HQMRRSSASEPIGCEGAFGFKGKNRNLPWGTESTMGRFRRRFAAAALAMLAALAAGCAGLPQAPGADGRSGLARGQPPEGAYLADGALLLLYRIDGRVLTLRAQWPAEDVARNRESYLVAQLDVAGDDPPQIERELGSAARVRLVDGKQWQRMMAQVLLELAPSDESRAVLLAVQGRDVAVYREGGKLRVISFVDKPPGVRIERTVSDQEFAARARRVVGEELGASGPALIDIGGGAADAFLLFHPAQRLSVYVVRPPDALSAGLGEPVGFALRSADALLLQSHVVAPLKSPVSTSFRLLWRTLHAGTALLPRGAAATGKAPPLAAGSSMDLAAWEQRLDALVSSKRSRGTLEFLVDGAAFFPRFVDAVQSARQSVWLRVYIFDRDDYAVAMADLLRKRSQDVDVRVLLDHLGTVVAGQMPPAGPMPAGFRPPESIIEYLRAGSAVKVVASPNPVFTSDHTKAMFVDRELAFVGGMNIGREYRYEWHDLMAEVRGPIVAPLRRDFELSWIHASAGDVGFVFRSLERDERRLLEPQAADMVDLRPLYTRTGQPEILEAQLSAMRAAQRSIYVEQPYLSDGHVLSELIRARQRGVDVRVVLPSRGDSGFMNSANLVTSQLLLRSGVRVYAYPGMTHVKAAIYDGWACFGSANMDNLSLRVNRELDLATSDPAAVARLREQVFEADFSRSREITEIEPLGWSVYLSDFIAGQL
ncbi:MAG: phosphatidylserine/phosphatidylglycerophosphate/cardiolipin synthase family protein, partial [Burkholderiales bacterium]